MSDKLIEFQNNFALLKEKRITDAAFGTLTRKLVANTKFVKDFERLNKARQTGIVSTEEFELFMTTKLNTIKASPIKATKPKTRKKPLPKKVTKRKANQLKKLTDDVNKVVSTNIKWAGRGMYRISLKHPNVTNARGYVFLEVRYMQSEDELNDLLDSVQNTLTKFVSKYDSIGLGEGAKIIVDPLNLRSVYTLKTIPERGQINGIDGVMVNSRNVIDIFCQPEHENVEHGLCVLECILQQLPWMKREDIIAYLLKVSQTKELSQLKGAIHLYFDELEAHFKIRIVVFNFLKKIWRKSPQEISKAKRNTVYLLFHDRHCRSIREDKRLSFGAIRGGFPLHKNSRKAVKYTIEQIKPEDITNRRNELKKNDSFVGLDDAALWNKYISCLKNGTASNCINNGRDVISFDDNSTGESIRYMWDKNDIYVNRHAIDKTLKPKSIFDIYSLASLAMAEWKLTLKEPVGKVLSKAYYDMIKRANLSCGYNYCEENLLEKRESFTILQMDINSSYGAASIDVRFPKLTPTKQFDYYEQVALSDIESNYGYVFCEYNQSNLRRPFFVSRTQKGQMCYLKKGNGLFPTNLILAALKRKIKVVMKWGLLTSNFHKKGELFKEFMDKQYKLKNSKNGENKYAKYKMTNLIGKLNSKPVQKAGFVATRDEIEASHLALTCDKLVDWDVQKSEDHTDHVISYQTNEKNNSFHLTNDNLVHITGFIYAQAMINLHELLDYLDANKAVVANTITDSVLFQIPTSKVCMLKRNFVSPKLGKFKIECGVEEEIYKATVLIPTRYRLEGKDKVIKDKWSGNVDRDDFNEMRDKLYKLVEYIQAYHKDMRSFDRFSTPYDYLAHITELPATVVFLHVYGRAGTGKTTLIQKQYLGKDKIAVTSTTGAAADNIGSSCATIHSRFYLFPQTSIEQCWINLQTNKDRLVELRTIQTIVIDECSMFNLQTLTKLDQILRYIHNINKPFGLVEQIVCVGDSNQLPIVNGQVWSDHEYVQDAITQNRFIDNPLTENHRQNTDPRFKQLLDDILDKKQISARMILEMIPECRIKEEQVDYTDTSILNVAYKNAECDVVNAKYLQEVSGNIIKINEGIDLSTDEFKGITSTLKIGCQVVVRHNYNNMAVFNGSKATVLSTSIGKVRATIKLQLAKDDRIITLLRVHANDGVTRFFPLSLGYCITIHCCQGMTLDNIIIRGTSIDLSKTHKNLWYVAMSRTRTLDGVKIIVEDIVPNYADYDPTQSYGDIDFSDMVDSYKAQDAKRKFSSRLILKALIKKWHKRGNKEEYYITPHFIQYLAQKSKRCALCNYVMHHDKRRNKNMRLTVDRIDDNIPHLKDNCVLACYKCNVSHNKNYYRKHPAFTG